MGDRPRPYGLSPSSWVRGHIEHNPDASVSRITDAIRLSVLAVGAVRLRFQEEPSNRHSAQRIAKQAKDRVLFLLDDVLKDPERHVDEVEGALAAMLSCTVALVSRSKAAQLTADSCCR